MGIGAAYVPLALAAYEGAGSFPAVRGETEPMGEAVSRRALVGTLASRRALGANMRLAETSRRL